MKLHVVLVLSLITALAHGESALADENWPQWRGPNLDGSSDSTDLPTQWGPDQNIKWSTPLPAWSGGTPIIWGDRIFVMTPSAGEQSESSEEAADENEDRQQGRRFGRRRGGGGGRNPGGQTLMVMCISKTDGKVLWEKALDEGNQLFRKGNSTSPSPVTDGETVWTVTGNGVVTALDFDGNVKWTRNIQDDYGRFGLNWGYGSSPLLYDGKLYIEVLHGMRTDEPSYLLALDGSNGETVFKVDRPTDAVRESPDAYTTPALVETESGPQIVIAGGDYVTGHDPQTGEEIWRSSGLNPRRDANFRIIASPVAYNGMVYAPTRVKPLLALKAGGNGDVSDSRLLWKFEGAGGTDVPTPVIDGNHFFIINDQGIATCLDAETGEVLGGPKRTISGTVSSSPLLADGKIYITNETGETMVVSATPDFEELALNPLDGSYTLSSIAVSGNELFLRTGTHLYCISESQ